MPWAANQLSPEEGSHAIGGELAEGGTWEMKAESIPHPKPPEGYQERGMLRGKVAESGSGPVA